MAAGVAERWHDTGRHCTVLINVVVSWRQRGATGGPTLDIRTGEDGFEPPASLWLPRRLRDDILAHLSATQPLEAVGLLAIEPDAAAPARAVHFFQGTNIDASPSRYTMDPAEVIAAFDTIEARGWRLGAIVHSHPATPAVPSETDLREANYPDALLVIVSFARTPPEMRAWQVTPTTEIEQGTASEVPIVVADNGSEEGA